jgi:DMSO/TMAO reductase YedYZ molybdopterin-dependent catalytic subunit
MTEDLDTVSSPARVADPGEGITLDELRLAARNHAMPLEALDYDVTPVGLHYLLTHYDIPVLDHQSWRLTVGGHVEQPVTLDLAALQERPQVTHRVTLECAGNGRARLSPRPVSQPWLDEAVGTADWTGTPLAPLLRQAGIRGDAVDVVFTGADHGIERGVEQDYQRGLPVEEVLRDDVILAYALNGQPLPPQHGAPVRLIVPGWYGMTQVKWLVRIDVLDEPFTGFQNETAYRLKQSADDAGMPVTRIEPRALVRPPGFPDFQTRLRIIDRGVHELTGRAWSGRGPVTRVDVSVDGGETWAETDLGPHVAPYAWRSWRWTWEAAATGRHDVCARATDATGQVQPMDDPWNLQGMANNAVHRVPVFVR